MLVTFYIPSLVKRYEAGLKLVCKNNLGVQILYRSLARQKTASEEINGYF